LVLVPQCEGEHAAKALDAGGAPRFPGVHDYLGVAFGAEHVPKARELGNEGLEVVNLAVEHHNDRAIFVVERLLARSQVDDRKPPVAEADARLDVERASIRAAVVLRLVHAREESAWDLPSSPQVHDSRDSAQGPCPSRVNSAGAPPGTGTPAAASVDS
jgi:hypothetical protein